MSALVKWMDDTFYPSMQRNWDDDLLRQRVLQHLSSNSWLLDYGAGRGNVAQMNFRGRVAHAAGVDVEPAVRQNPFLDSSGVIDLTNGRIPYDDNMFDVVVSDNVLEHVSDPVGVFREVRRVLKPGGVFIAKTPNRRHYMPLIARMSPLWFHRAFNRLRGREVHDTFPTLYRCNDARSVETAARSAGLSVRSISFIEGRPEYLRVSFLTYWVGWLYERVVNSSAILAPLRGVMLIELASPSGE